MSLETSLSIRSEWKIRLEIFLSTCWRIYSSIEKYFYRRRKWGSSDSNLTKLTAEAAEAYLRYRGSLKMKDLKKAIEKFWQAKNYRTSSKNQRESLYCLYLEGFAEKTSKRDLLYSIRANLEGRDAELRVVTKKFRPDVAYRLPGDFGLYSGLSLQITASDHGLIRAVAHLLSKLKDAELLTVEKFHVNNSRADALSNQFLSNIIDLLPLLEAGCDQELANSICEELENVDVTPLLYFAAPGFDFTAQGLARLYLIARRPLPKALSSRGWKVFEMVNPQWQKVDSFENPLGGNISEGLRSNSEALYTSMAPPSMVVLEDVALTSGDVISSDQFLFNIDPSSNPAFSFVAGHQEVVGTPANLGFAAVRIPKDQGSVITEGILVSSRSDTNWFHWLIETLPKFLYLDSEVPKDVPVIISDRIPQTAKESLQLLTDRPIIEISALAATRVGKLFVSSPVLFHPDPVELHLKPVTNTINTEALIWLRERILGMAKKNLREARGEPSIYVKRSGGARSIVNSRRVDKMLSKFGFVALEPVQMTFLEQVLAFNSAERIALVGGASMANLIFCSPGSVVLTLRSKFTVGYKMPEILAGVAGAKVIPISGRPVGNLFRHSFLEKVHAHYSIGIRQIKRAVRQVF